MTMSWRRANGVLPRPGGIDGRGAALELTDVARRQARLRELGDPRQERGRVVGDARPLAGEREVGVGQLHCQDQIQSGLHEPLGSSLLGELRRGDSTWALPQDLDGPSERGFELLGTDGEEERQYRIGQKARFDEIGACEPELAQADLKVRAVPQGQRHSLLLRHPIVEDDAGGEPWCRVGVYARRRAGTLA